MLSPFVRHLRARDIDFDTEQLCEHALEMTPRETEYHLHGRRAPQQVTVPGCYRRNDGRIDVRYECEWCGHTVSVVNNQNLVREVGY